MLLQKISICAAFPECFHPACWIGYFLECLENCFLWVGYTQCVNRSNNSRYHRKSMGDCFYINCMTFLLLKGIQAHAQTFGVDVFQARIRAFVNEKLTEYRRAFGYQSIN